MIDGLDGLLVGSVIIEGGALSIVLLLLGLPGMEIASIAVLACLGFLPYNRHPAKTFSGDCGSESLGFLMGMLSLPLLQSLPLGIGALTPLFLFAYPLTDLTAAVLRRLLRGKSPFSADRGHLHHRIFDAGVDHARCTGILLTLTGAMGGIGVLLCRPDLWEGAAVACFLGVMLLIRLRGYILNFS
jgi:UDP-GlcNAc:undecaprenyl-phosphate GlcNAc-1-phosphate transferase